MFPFTHQRDAMDCGPSCLQMIAKHYGKHYRLESLRDSCFLSREGVSLLGISEAAEKIGFRTTGVKISFEQRCEAPLPCIVHWKQQYFAVVYDIKKGRVKAAAQRDEAAMRPGEAASQQGEKGKAISPSEGHSPREAPCTDCNYQYNCPSPSNYERVIGQLDLCCI
jgi:ABC-type bacteriocin/lantibiotic exporter with double-glycine peptidase domain